jgi:enoyl-CoA hydratase/carnithine racemase
VTELTQLAHHSSDGAILVEDVEVGHGRQVRLITLNRPSALNAINAEMLGELCVSLEEVASGGRVCTVLLRGSGRAFCAGGDLKVFADIGAHADAFAELVRLMHSTIGRMRYLPVPIVCLVNGVATAGGLELMLSADFCYAARSARIGDAHQKYGQMGGGGALTLLPRLIGPARTRELVFSGRLLSADEAMAWGLVNRVVDDEELVGAGIAFAEEVAAASPLGIANAKEVITRGWENGTGVSASLELEVERTLHYCATSEDAREGLAAFAEKREPRFLAR